MELPPFDLTDFTKYKQGQAVVKECDMETDML